MTDIDAAEARRAIEHYYEQGWTDGLPVVPVTESYLADFLATTGRDPDEVLIPMPHLNKNLTVRLAAINAALAGCLPEYFPVVLAGWDAFLADGMVTRSIWQSTTGTAPFVVVYGPARQRLGLNSRGTGCRVLWIRPDSTTRKPWRTSATWPTTRSSLVTTSYPLTAPCLLVSLPAPYPPGADR